MQQICPYSGETFIPKRRNQVFANADNRRGFHNENAAVLRRVKAPIDRALERNFIIVSELLQEGETKTFQREELLLKGYNPNIFTHLDMLDGKTSLCLYHFILPKTENPNTITISYPRKND
jgi:hypothetical protein